MVSLTDERVEFLVGLLYTLTAMASIGGGTMLFGYDLLTEVQTFMDGQIVIDYATIGSVFALGYVWFLNRPSIGRLGPTYQAAIAGAVILIGLGAYDPAFAASRGMELQLLLLGVSLAGYWTIANN